MKNIPQYMMYVLLFVGAVVALLSVLNDSHDPILLTMKILAVACAAIAILSYVFDMVVKPETIKETLMLVVGLIVVYGIGYTMAGEEILESYPKGFTVSDSKMAGAGLITFYILGALAIGSIIVTSLFNAIKNR